MRRFGIDVGGVIIDRANDDTDTSFFSDNFLATTVTEGCFESVAHIVSALAPDDVFIVSKCGKRIQEKTLAWLAHHRFYERTGLKEAHVLFCLTRPEKAPICRDLRITDFVDDRADVLHHIAGIVERRFLFASSEAPADGMIAVAGWDDLIAKALA